MPSSAVKTCARSEEHTSELQSHDNLVCRLLLEKTSLSAQPRPGPPGVAPSLLPRPIGGPAGVGLAELAQEGPLHDREVAWDRVLFFFLGWALPHGPPPLPPTRLPRL